MWRWGVVGILSSLIWGSGVAAMYGDDYKISVGLYFFGIALFVAKFLSWEENRKLPLLKRWIASISIFVVGSALFVGSLWWIQVRRSDVASAKAINVQPKAASIPVVSPSTELNKHGKKINNSKSQPQVIVQTAQTFGNLKGRAVALSQKIMNDLWLHGWQGGQKPPWNFPTTPMPTAPEERAQWYSARSNDFRWESLEEVIDIRNEFAQLHIRDEELEKSLKYVGLTEQGNNEQEKEQIKVLCQPFGNSTIPPMSIEQIAERLLVMADQIK